MPSNLVQQAPQVTVGVDIGGTGTRLVALDSSGVIHQELRRATPPPGTSDVVGALAGLVAEVAGNTRPTAIGIGASGPVDADGIIRNPDTLAAYSGLALTEALSDRLGLRCVIDNDAVTAAIGEQWLGAGRGSRALLTVTLGTGIGVAMLVDGRPVRSADGTHPEGGHIAVAGPTAPCYCWLDPCWEQLASRTALDRLTHGRTAEVADHARRQDAAAQNLFHTYGARVGAGLATLATIYRPDRIVLGGAAAQYLDVFIDSLRESMDRPANFAWTGQITAAELGDIAGAVGGAVLAR